MGRRKKPPKRQDGSTQPKQKKRRLTLQSDASVTASQPGPDNPLLDACPPQVSQKLWHRFYEPLILLSAYGKSQGKHVRSDETSSEGYLDSGNKTLGKKFLDELAYICDYSPSGSTVAAVAVQDGPQLVYWVAANANQGSKVKPFLSDILQLLGQVYDASEERVSTLKLQISDRAMVFSARKLQYYRNKLQNTIRKCVPLLEKQNTEGANSLKEWLISLQNSDLDPISFCRLCYEARDSGFLEVLKRRANGSNIHEGDSYAARCARIRHLIGRLGSHMKAARVLVKAGKHYPRLFTDYSIESATHHPNFMPPVYRSKSSINGIINRMVTDPQACEYYRNELRSQDEKFHLTLEQRIRDEYKNPKFKLRVHAEIILLDLFHCKNLRFLDDIRYIGVSKPSCFLCYRYFQAHPLQARTSGCSNNLYLQWQPPYVQQDSRALVKEQEDILNTMIKGIRLFVLDNIVPDYRGFEAHPDSTTGVTDMRSDLHFNTSTLLQLNEGSSGLDRATWTSDRGMGNLTCDTEDLSSDMEELSSDMEELSSDMEELSGDMEGLTCGSPSRSTAEDADSSDDSEDGGVSLL